MCKRRGRIATPLAPAFWNGSGRTGRPAAPQARQIKARTLSRSTNVVLMWVTQV